MDMYAQQATSDPAKKAAPYLGLLFLHRNYTPMQYTQPSRVSQSTFFQAHLGLMASLMDAMELENNTKDVTS